MAVTATEKVLQRKDGSTLIVSVVLALAVLQFISSVTTPLVGKIMGSGTNQPYPDLSFNDQYVAPLVALVLQLVAIELVVWLVVGVRALASSKPAKKKK